CPPRDAPGPAVPSFAMTAVLFTCAGQRVDIVGAFRRAGATTVAADVNPLAPALYHADHYALVPRVDAPEYVAPLRRIVHAPDVTFPGPRAATSSSSSSATRLSTRSSKRVSPARSSRSTSSVTSKAAA